MKRLFALIAVVGVITAFAGMSRAAKVIDDGGKGLYHEGRSYVAWPLLKPGAGSPGNYGAKTGFQPPESFHDLVQKISPAVVNISTTKKVTMRQYNPFQGFGPRFGPQDPFDDFFDKFFEGMPERNSEQHSLGSGFIFNADGQILTNNHVVAQADEIIVTLSDEKKFKAEIVGRDEETDLAVIRIKADHPLPYVNLGDSDSLLIGDWVIAIGNPFGLSHTVTAGICSAKGRVIGAGPYDDFIQTDASINPGNSGGPLFDMNGYVIGINTAIFATGQGLGFAIPVNMAKKLIPQLVEHGRVLDRGWLGVMIQGITRELAKSFGLPEDQAGALVGDVVPDSPAAKAGLKRGDVIVAFDGKAVTKSTDLPGIVATTQPDRKVAIDIIREGKKQGLEVVLGNKSTAGKVAGREETPSSGGADKLGLVVKAITASEAHELGVPPDKGILVDRIEPGSISEGAGVRSGDVIYEINGKEVGSVKEYGDAVQNLKEGSIVRLLIRRQGGTIYLAFSL